MTVDAFTRAAVCGWMVTLMWNATVDRGRAQERAGETAAAINTDLVGRWRDDVIVTPVNQLLTPYGLQVDLPGMRPQALGFPQMARSWSLRARRTIWW